MENKKGLIIALVIGAAVLIYFLLFSKKSNAEGAPTTGVPGTPGGGTGVTQSSGNIVLGVDPSTTASVPSQIYWPGVGMVAVAKENWPNIGQVGIITGAAIGYADTSKAGKLSGGKSPNSIVGFVFNNELITEGTQDFEAYLVQWRQSHGLNRLNVGV